MSVNAGLRLIDPRLCWWLKRGASSELLSSVLDAYTAVPGAGALEVVLVGPGQPEALLRTGRADVALLHRPYNETAGFDTEDLHTEEQVLILPAGHRFARRPHISMAEVNRMFPGPQLYPRFDYLSITSGRKKSATGA